MTITMMTMIFRAAPTSPSPSPSPSVLYKINPSSHRNGNRDLNSSISLRPTNTIAVRSMTITPSVRVSDGNLTVRGRRILSSVPAGVVSSSAASSAPIDGIFLGADFPASSSRHVIPLGLLRGLRFLSCFRFKLWWMSQMMGTRGRDVPHETQFLLLESESSSDYIVFLPLVVDGRFRACLQGNPSDELELCLESGDSSTVSAGFSHAVFVGTATDPFAAITGAVRAVQSHLKSFRCRTEKRLPGIVDYFGWCTWDAFYQDVSQEGVEAGLQSLSAGGAPPGFVIIDDGWQSVSADENNNINNDGDGDGDGDDDEGGGGEKQDPSPSPISLERLIGIKENSKFQSSSGGGGGGGEEKKNGIGSIVGIAKSKYGVKYVYVWHAITGYWGGVRPGTGGYGSRIRYPAVSPGVVENEPGMKTDVLTVQGVGLVDPNKESGAYQLFDDMHGHLASAGVDGVKVDVQSVLETLGEGVGGRVAVTRKFHQALDASVAKNFGRDNNGCIACMSHHTDALYCSQQVALVRASDDFYPRDPVSHTIHIASVAYNTLFLGEFMLADWDMFHSLHPSAADYHASARAISGGPIYVSDSPGKHDFELLRKLVLPDGSILRPRLPARPTKDCLFSDPTRDGTSLLKIWNMNKFTGVLGVYNCQGAAWSSTQKINTFHNNNACSCSCSCYVKTSDVHLIWEAAAAAAATDNNGMVGDCAVYRHRDGELVVLPPDAALPVTLDVLEHEIFTVSPIKDLVGLGGGGLVRFAPLGLVDMYNGGGAIQGLSFSNHNNNSSDGGGGEVVVVVSMEVKGCGRLGAYSSIKPTKLSLLVSSSSSSSQVEVEKQPQQQQFLGSGGGGKGSIADYYVPLDFAYDLSTGFLSVQLESMPPEGGDGVLSRVHTLAVEFHS